jgi:hypothetical protein
MAINPKPNLLRPASNDQTKGLTANAETSTDNRFESSQKEATPRNVE